LTNIDQFNQVIVDGLNF